MVAGRRLPPGQARALVRLDMRAHAAGQAALRHRGNVALKRVAIDDKGGRGDLIEAHGQSA